MRDVGAEPILNPFPLDIARRSERANAHHNPMDAWKHDRVGRYRPKVPQRIPRAIPDDRFNTLFTALPSNRDRAMVAFWISTGARASELLGVRQCDVDPGQQLITVVRKGSRAIQQLPAAADAFVMAPPVSARHTRQGAAWPDPAGVVDLTPTAPPADLSRRAPNVRAGQRLPGLGLDVARPAGAQRCDTDGAGSADDAVPPRRRRATTRSR